MLATWLSYADLSRLMIAAVTAERVGCAVVWGASRNARMTWWGRDARGGLRWLPRDSADGYAGQLAGKVSDSPIAERYQGGGFAALDYTRVDPPPERLFGSPDAERAAPTSGRG
jgi:uronate dehydrogenase